MLSLRPSSLPPFIILSFLSFFLSCISMILTHTTGEWDVWGFAAIQRRSLLGHRRPRCAGQVGVKKEGRKEGRGKGRSRPRCAFFHRLSAVLPYTQGSHAIQCGPHGVVQQDRVQHKFKFKGDWFISFVYGVVHTDRSNTLNIGCTMVRPYFAWFYLVYGFCREGD